MKYDVDQMHNYMKNLMYACRLCKNNFKIKKGTNEYKIINIIFLFLTAEFQSFPEVQMLGGLLWRM